MSVKQLRKCRRFESFYCQVVRRLRSSTINENIKRTSDIIDGERDGGGLTNTGEYKLWVRVWEYIRVSADITVSNRDIFSDALYSTRGFSV